jgi:hypothetical protein
VGAVRIGVVCGALNDVFDQSGNQGQRVACRLTRPTNNTTLHFDLFSSLLLVPRGVDLLMMKEPGL